MGVLGTGQINQPLTVTQVVMTIKAILEEAFPELYFEGEISEIKSGKTGHVYLTIKDERSQLSAVVWAGVARLVNFKLESGVKVACWGRPTLYPQRGSMQIVLSRLMLAGEGALQKRFLELKRKLEEEGYFSESRKRPLPFMPRAIGIVTSGQGAVIHDIQVKLNERFPSIPKYLVDVAVQGDGAAEEIAEGIKLLSSSGLVDVIILARGGGSLQDLWAFNEEVVVKSIFSSKVPIVSGVGHETDITLADLAADLRAPTPTAAAEFVVPRRADLMQRVGELERRILDVSRWFMPVAQRLDELSNRLDQSTTRFIYDYNAKVKQAEDRLKRIEPFAVVRQLNLQLDLAVRKLSRCVESVVLSCTERIAVAQTLLIKCSPVPRVSIFSERINSLNQRLSGAIISEKKLRLTKLNELTGRLESISPRAVLKRGYSYIKRDQRFVARRSELSSAEKVSITFFDGSIDAKIEGQ